MSGVVLIDYGSGNLRSAENALRRAAEDAPGRPEVRVSSDPDTVAAADRVVLPGVGAFTACMRALADRPGLLEALGTAARDRGRPFLGICVGMQLLAERGLEFGVCEGLGWIPGDVRRLEPRGVGRKVPHVGWNDVSPARAQFLLPEGSGPYYFTHSYAFHPRDPGAVAGVCDHGGPFAAAVVQDNLAGVQFHPEKSQAEGLRLLGRFLAWRP